MNNLELLKVYEFDNKVRYGINTDGGYVLGEINNISDINNTYDCYISAGVGDEESFTRDFINKYNMNEYNSFCFDGTVLNYPYQYTKKISFIKKNINIFNDDDNSNLDFLINKYNNIFLKMDIEGGEYPWLLYINEDQLNKFKQIVIEFHGITNDSFNCNYNNKIKCLEKLNNTHYLIHAHGNNNNFVVNDIPNVIELTYINKKYFKIIPNLNTKLLPINGLDFPNKPYTDDFNLCFYPFVNLEFLNIQMCKINSIDTMFNLNIDNLDYLKIEMIDKITSFKEKEATELCKIMYMNKSDKGSIDIFNAKHNYTIFYQHIFKDIQYNNLRIFELGLGTNNINLPSNMSSNGRTGASLYGWHEFFLNSKIYGADIDRNILFNTDYIKTYYCDQTNPHIIKNMWDGEKDLCDEFDIIIDDWLHEFNANVCFFENSIHKLAKNGYFIIEDLIINEIPLFNDKINYWKNEYKDLIFIILQMPSRINTFDNNLLIVKRC